MGDINKIIIDKKGKSLIIENHSDSYSFDFKSNTTSNISFSTLDGKVYSSFCLFRNMINELIDLGYLDDHFIKSIEDENWMNVEYCFGKIIVNFPHTSATIVISKNVDNSIVLIPFDRLFSDLEFCEGEEYTNNIDDYSSSSNLRLVLE